MASFLGYCYYTGTYHLGWKSLVVFVQGISNEFFNYHDINASCCDKLFSLLSSVLRSELIQGARILLTTAFGYLAGLQDILGIVMFF